ncbi:glycosyltransferase family 2 protein [Methylotenera versatilis]|uniref:Rhamnosyltransferase n=1 Tax=Methylotenera versatilis (strain 301) TaxID=666681 RepID=D7DHT5_METV0|nr:glycosyltransferase family 2 protein [Methylotenera versatilis]ADI29620.1 rhamnosyltransferase [Methylotenera versatilis 301]
MIGGVIVAYYPDKEQFLSVVQAALNDLDFLLVVNNGEAPITIITDILAMSIDKKKFEIIENSQNLGIAKALNIGLKILIEKGCSYFLMLDQDSLVPKNMVSTLLNSLEKLNSGDTKVAAIGPAYFNSRLNKFAPFIQFGKMSLKKIEIDQKIEVTQTHFLITSGTLLTLDAIQNIGLMEEGLFIDYVDTEWCLRALSKGYKLYGDSGVIMEHSLGDNPLVLLGWRFPMHSPLRHYYLVRNAIHLIRKSYIPLNWRFIIFWRMLRSFIFYSLIPENRSEHFKKMKLGLSDGLAGVLGRMNERA